MDESQRSSGLAVLQENYNLRTQSIVVTTLAAFAFILSVATMGLLSGYGSIYIPGDFVWIALLSVITAGMAGFFLWRLGDGARSPQFAPAIWHLVVLCVFAVLWFSAAVAPLSYSYFHVGLVVACAGSSIPFCSLADIVEIFTWLLFAFFIVAILTVTGQGQKHSSFSSRPTPAAPHELVNAPGTGYYPPPPPPEGGYYTPPPEGFKGMYTSPAGVPQSPMQGYAVPQSPLQGYAVPQEYVHAAPAPPQMHGEATVYIPPQSPQIPYQTPQIPYQSPQIPYQSPQIPPQSPQAYGGGIVYAPPPTSPQISSQLPSQSPQAYGEQIQHVLPTPPQNSSQPPQVHGESIVHTLPQAQAPAQAQAFDKPQEVSHLQ